MIASRAAAGQAGPQVTVYFKVPGGPWFVGLGGSGGPEVELGPYENPATARSDATKLRQFFASMISDLDDRRERPGGGGQVPPPPGVHGHRAAWDGQLRGRTADASGPEL